MAKLYEQMKEISKIRERLSDFGQLNKGLEKPDCYCLIEERIQQTGHLPSSP